MRTLKYDLDQAVIGYLLWMLTFVLLFAGAMLLNYFTLNNLFIFIGLLVGQIGFLFLFGFFIYRHVSDINTSLNHGLSQISTRLYYGLTLPEKPMEGKKTIEELSNLESDINELLERFNKIEPTINGEPTPKDVEINITSGKLLNKGDFNQAVFYLSQGNSSYRSAFILVKILNKDLSFFRNELFKAVSAAFPAAVYGDFSADTLAIFDPKVNSLRLFDEKIKDFYAHFVPSKIDKFRKGMDVAHIRLGASVYPYTSRRDLERDAVFALEKSKGCKLYLPAIRQTDIIHRETFESVGRLFLLNAEMLMLEAKQVHSKETFDRFIRQNLLKISSQFGFHDAGYLLFDETLKKFRVEYEEAHLKEHPTFIKMTAITRDLLDPIFALADASGALYGNQNDVLPPPLSRLLSNLNVKAFHFQTITDKDTPIGMIYFCSSIANRSLTVSEQTVLNFDASILGTFIKEIIHARVEDSKNTLLEHIIRLDERFIYLIDKSTYVIKYVSKTLLDYYSAQPLIGQVCYRVLHGRNEPCENCPLVVGTKEIALQNIAPLLFLRSEIQFSGETNEAAISIIPLQTIIKEMEPRYLDLELSIKNKARLEVDLRNFIHEDKYGYIFTMAVTTIPPTHSFVPEPGTVQLMNLMCRKFEKANFGDFLYRIAGNMIAAVFPGATRPLAFEMAENMFALIKTVTETNRNLHFWMALASFPNDFRDLNGFDAMTEAAFKLINKTEGQDLLYLADTKKIRKADRREYVLDLMKEALEHQKIEVYVNPIINVENGHPVGGELVSRLFDPNKGYLSTTEFLSLGGEMGMLPEIEKNALYAAGELWRNYGYSVFRQYGIERICVNVSTKSIMDRGFRETVKQIVSKYRFPKQFLQLEIAEKTIFDREDEVRQFLKELQNNDLTFAIDHFTDRMIELEAALSLSFTCINFDPELVRGIETYSSSFLNFDRLRNAIREKGGHIIVEGVETEEQADILRKLSIHMVEGFHFAKPMPITEFINFIKNSH